MKKRWRVGREELDDWIRCYGESSGEKMTRAEEEGVEKMVKKCEEE